MFKIKKLFPVFLFIHDGAAAPGDAGGADGGNPAPDLASRNKSGQPQVIYGKQATTEGAKAPEGNDPATDKKAAFRQLIGTDYKDEFAEYFQEQFNRRFKDHKATEERLAAASPVLSLLSERYGVADNDPAKILEALEGDDYLWESLADEAGLTPEQYKEQLKLRREVDQLRQEKSQQDAIQQANQKYAEWVEQGEALQADFPGFDLAQEMQASEDFRNLLAKGVDVRTAYQATHFNEIVSGIATTAGKRAETNVVRNIQSKGKRPVEAGSQSAPGAVIKDDASKFTKMDRQEIARRVARGEKISL